MLFNKEVRRATSKIASAIRVTYPKTPALVCGSLFKELCGWARKALPLQPTWNSSSGNSSPKAPVGVAKMSCPLHLHLSLYPAGFLPLPYVILNQCSLLCLRTCFLGKPTWHTAALENQQSKGGLCSFPPHSFSD